MNDGLVVDLLAAGVLYGTPLLVAALGELLAERAGVLNLGIEGMMLMGAVVGFLVSQRLGGPTALVLMAAFAAAALAGAAAASVHATMVLSLRANQIVSGLALTIACGGIGLSSYIGARAGLSEETAQHALRPIDVPLLSDLPLLGPVVFSQNALVYASWLMALGIAFYLYRTHAGLHLRAVGEEPEAADAMGIDVRVYRYAHTIVGGGFAGLAGAAYSLAITPGFTDGMTAGAGWIALALVIFGFWRPAPVVAGAYLFGVVTSLGFVLQARGVDVPTEVFRALPYLFTIAAIVAISNVAAGRRLGAPKALGEYYEREEA